MKRGLVYILLMAGLFLGSTLIIMDLPAQFAPQRSESEIILRSNYNDVSRDMTVDSQGNVIIVGGRMDILNPPDLSSSKFHAVKVSPTAQEIWTKTWNYSSYNMLVSVDVDSLDNIVIAGIKGFNNDNATGYVLKMNPDGDLIWQVEFARIEYDWDIWPPHYDFFGLEIESTTDNIFLVGSLHNDKHRTLITCLNSSGSEQWRTEWGGPPDSNGTRPIAFWLSSQEGIVVAGRILEDDLPYALYGDDYIAAFDTNGVHLWNRTDFCLSALETGSNEFVASTDSWRGFNQVTRFSYDFEELSSFDLLVGDHYSVEIQGFALNGTRNIVGYGEVTSLVAGSSVDRNYRALFQGPQAPQTLLLSCSPSGELNWYDFLVIGRISEPSGVGFDSEHRMIVAGHTSEWSFYENSFFVVFGFKPTPFLPSYDSLLLGLIPLFNILVVALARESESMRNRGESFIGLRNPRCTVMNVVKYLALAELVLSLTMQLTLASGGGGGPPPVMAYLPDWVTQIYWSLPIGLLTMGLIYLALKFLETRPKPKITEKNG